ncbi:xanthine dehydrogenase subunit XdhA [Candidatus Formimonas warabiya]|uniref:Xanthine dehydrogenase molybdenum-binding subunit XdhA n=1 Tax=Formimonas warabiya TaxID=1761012 RepID=A0A3G1KQU7_FORW1|nr:xanthine dehydrogenase subunit XdhA [Candidatus Formimonas warabiya]ATW24849.1 xanthine dehydrogenase molybdenum-binding subunit XdhA [Candidatus Formimonas warabiya]
MDNQYIGKSVPRIDAIPKVMGKAKYIGDIKMPGMLYGKILWSSVAHAYIKKIDTSKAKNFPGIKAVITWEDVPRILYCSAGHPYPDDSPQDMYILDKKVRYVGDPVAAVAAESREIAEEAIRLIEVEYEELPAILSPEDALDEHAPEIHEGTKNICGENISQFGDVAKGFEDSNYVFEDEFRTPIVQHCPIENHVSLVYLEDDGRYTVHSATQVPFHLRRILSQALNIPIRKIKVIKTYVGGGFGGKEDVCQEPINVVLTQKTGKPVLLEYTREEEFVSTRTRHSTIIKLKTGVTKEGKILARQMDVLSNTGAYAGHGHGIVYSMSSHFPTLYPAPNTLFKGKSVYTNMPVASAMRSYGISQLNFATEAHMENIAGRLGIDPLEFRRKNLISPDFKCPNEYFIVNSYGLGTCLEKGEKLSNWKTKRNREHDDSSVTKKGLGMACFSYQSHTYPAVHELSGARIKLNEDGSATLFLGSAEVGQGNDTAMAQIAAETLGISIDTINVIAVDTDICPFDNGAYGSRQLFVGGMAVKKAAIKCKEALLGYAAKMLNKSPESLDTREGFILGENDEKLLSVRKAAMKAYYDHKHPITICFEEYFSPNCNPLTFGAVFAEVEVDTGTGKVEVEKIWALHDSGKIINPLLAEGQVHGGIFMGLGYGVSEQLLIDQKTGRTLNGNLLDYKLPTMLDMPPVDVTFIETEEPTTAYGNKSLGEPPCISVAPAIRNAVLNAVGVEYNEIPLTPERVLMKLKKGVTR